MKKKETILQDEIRKVLSKYGRVFRMNSGVFRTSDGRYIRCGTKGMSDLLFVGKGYIAWLECKTTKGQASPEQLEFLEDMHKLGHRAAIVKSVDEALQIIKNGGDFCMISTNYKDLNDNLIPEGKYEAVIKSAFLDMTKGGTEFINVQLIVRNDVEQIYQNKYIFHSIWKKKEPNEADKNCDGFSAQQLFKLCKAIDIPENKEFENLEQMLAELVGKPVLVGIKHDEYNGYKQEKVSFVAKTKFPDCKHEFKKKEPEIEVDDSDLPF